MKRLLLLVLLALALPLHAATITVEPPYADTRTFVVVKIVDDICGVPLKPVVTINGSTIDIRVTVTNGICITVRPVQTVVVPLGVLKPGLYQIVVTGDVSTSLPVTLAVRGVDEFRVIPPGAPVEGGTRVTLEAISRSPERRGFSSMASPAPTSRASATSSPS